MTLLHPHSGCLFVRPVVAAVALGGLLSLTAGASQDTVPRTVYLAVLDDANAPVTGLTAKEVTIVENGALRQVTDIGPATDPLCVAILVDTAQPPAGQTAPTRDLRAGVSALVGIIQTTNPESEIALMETGGAAVVTVRFTNKGQDVTRAVNRLVQTQRTSAVMLEGLLSMSETIASRPTRRRAIVTVDFDSTDPSRIREQEYAEALTRAGASVWAVSVRRGAGLAAARDAILDWATTLTGGLRLTVVSVSALESQLQIVANAIASQYAVTYQQPAGTTISDLRAAATRGSKFLVTRALAK
ncbi:MAG TPA: hypothetical protein VLD67_01005 [Vicinamibacterales bacterium]|nr:hypothetical protein [Vicinamibacterales bacterium]